LGHAEPVLSVSFSPDGRRIASTSGFTTSESGVLKVWDVGDGHEIFAATYPSATLERVTYSPDGRRLATAAWDGTVKLWDAEPGTETLTLRGPQGRVWGVNFSPKGDALVAAGLDGNIILWDAKPEEENRATAPKSRQEPMLPAPRDARQPKNATPGALID